MKNANNKLTEESDIFINSIEDNKKNKSLNILDKIIESLPFSKYHFITTMICIFSMTCEGYLRQHLYYSQNRIKKIYNWTNSEIHSLYTLQLIFQSIGAFISTNIRSINWEITSNSLLAFIGFINIIMIILYSDPIVYFASICIYSVFHGFIGNICTNSILELMNIKIRGYLFLTVMSFTFFGRAAYGGLVWYLLSYNINDPHSFLIGLLVSQFFLTIFLSIQLDSPRILFNNNHFTYIYEYMKEIENNDAINDERVKIKIIQKLESVKNEIDNMYEKQEDEGVINGYYVLFTNKYFKNTLMSILIINFSVSFISNIKDSYDYFVDYTEEKNYFRSYSYDQFVYYISIFVLINLCNIIYFVFNKISTKYYRIGSLVISLVLLISLLIIRNHFIHFLAIFEVFSYFFHYLIYLYFCEYVTTKLRNCISSTINITICFTYLFQGYLIHSYNDFNPYLAIVVSIILGFSLIIIDLYMNKEELRYMNIAEIDLMILSKKS